MLDFYSGPPGIVNGPFTAARVVFRQRSEMFLAGGKSIDGVASRDAGNTPITVLRPGLLMGKITATGLYAPSVIGVTTNAEAAGSTSIEAAAAVVTELIRRQGTTGTFKLTGPPAANGVVATETVTYSAASGTTITVTAIANAYVAGSMIQPTDGSETPRTFIPDWDGYGLKVVDGDGTSYASIDFPKFPVAGIVYSAQLLPWPADTSLRAWIVARLNDAFGAQLVFDGYY